MDLIKPTDVTVKTLDGEERGYTISRVPATVGRQFLAEFIPSALPKVGEYATNERCMLTMMGYVEAHLSDGGRVRLTTKGLVDNHVPDFEALISLEKAMIEHNTSFFKGGRGSTFFDALARKALLKIIEMLTPFSAQSSKKAAPLSKS